jgi:phosphate transport system ATP-binding protein
MMSGNSYLSNSPDSTRAGLSTLVGNHRQARHGQVSDDVKISIRDLDFYYGDTRALGPIDLDIRDRSMTALIGPSGCGKSTLIRTFNRLFDIYPDQRGTGQILIDGKNILDPDIDVTRLRGRIGMTFQRPNPFPLPIFENIAFGIRLHHRLSRAELAVRVEKALRDAALWD